MHGVSENCTLQMEEENEVMKPYRNLVRNVACAAGIVLCAMGSAAACGRMVLLNSAPLVMSIQGEGSAFTATVPGYEIETNAGDTCFIAVQLPKTYTITQVRFMGDDSESVFATFAQDKRLERSFGTSYQAFTAQALTSFIGTNIRLEIVFEAARSSHGLTQLTAALGLHLPSIATGRTDGAGRMLGHTGIGHPSIIDMVSNGQ